MSDIQQAVYQLLVTTFQTLNINPADAIPAMRKLADDAERVTQKMQQTSGSIN